MIDRYTLHSNQELLEGYFNTKFESKYEALYNAAPTMKLPIIKVGQPGIIEHAFWGLMSKWANNKTISPKLFNLTHSDALTKPMYQNGITQRRCAILADGFYVWKPVGKKKSIPYYIYKKDSRPFAITGIWEEYEDMESKASRSFMMLVRPSPTSLASYQDNFPSIIEGTEVEKWLNPNLDISGITELISASLKDDWNIHAVSPTISNVSFNQKKLIEPENPSDQHGNYTLFG